MKISNLTTEITRRGTKVIGFEVNDLEILVEVGLTTVAVVVAGDKIVSQKAAQTMSEPEDLEAYNEILRKHLEHTIPQTKQALK